MELLEQLARSLALKIYRLVLLYINFLRKLTALNLMVYSAIYVHLNTPCSNLGHLTVAFCKIHNLFILSPMDFKSCGYTLL